MNPSSMAPSSASRPASGSKPRVLVLEDNAESRLLLRHLLRRDFEATLVSGADAALDAAQSQSFDAALLDINLGEKRTGVDVFEAIRAMEQHRGLPVLACTAYALPGDRERFLEAGFVSYVSKPFVKAELISTLQQAVGVTS